MSDNSANTLVRWVGNGNIICLLVSYLDGLTSTRDQAAPLPSLRSQPRHEA